MAPDALAAVHETIRQLWDGGAIGRLNDAQLLQVFLTRPGAAAECAFAELVERHGPMVRRVSVDLLSDPYDADDAAQAAFLVLARKARSIRKPEALGSWLHGVAVRLARRLRVDAARRRKAEQHGGRIMAEQHRVAAPSDLEPYIELHEEIDRLPGKYRDPIVLCYLEGHTQEQAARRLGWPLGTVQTRLHRGRERLRSRLLRRGIGPALVGAAGLTLPPRAAAAASVALPAGWAKATAAAAAGFAARQTVAGLAAPRALALAEGMLAATSRCAVPRLGLAALAAVAAVGGAALSALPTPASRGAQRASPARAVVAQRALAATDAKDDAAAPIAVPLPAPEELRALLRRAADEGSAIARKVPQPGSQALAEVGKAQALAGDAAGARETLRIAAAEARGEFGGKSSAWYIWQAAHAQADAGIPDDAATTLNQALEAVRDPTGDLSDDDWGAMTLAAIAKDQARIGRRDAARRTADRLAAFVRAVSKMPAVSGSEEILGPRVAGALAAAGEFDRALALADGIRHKDAVLGEAALSAAKHLDRTTARPFVRESARRLAAIRMADERYYGLADVAEAQARVGDIDDARRTALSPGEIPARKVFDVTDAPLHALCRVANVQRETEDLRGARATLREAHRYVREHPQMPRFDSALWMIAHGQLAAGDLEDALQTVPRLPVEMRYPCLAQIARAQAVSGDPAAAAKTMAQAAAEAPDADQARRDPSWRAEVVRAEFLAQAGDTAAARATIGTIRDEFYRKMAFNRVAAARTAAGDVAGALRLALEAAPAGPERREALQGVGEGVAARRQLESAIKPAP